MRIFGKNRVSAEDKLLPMGDFLEFSGLKKTDWLEKNPEEYVKAGEKLLDTPYPLLEAHDYMRFAREGNRSVYERFYFKRRGMLLTFLWAELAEKKGRFADRLADGVWHILEETTWVLPAHIRSRGTPLIDEYGEKLTLIDLFSASTAATLSVVFLLGKEILDGVTPVICERVRYELYRRVIRPFIEENDMWWMGNGKRRELNNWTPWICSNALTACALCFEDKDIREKVAKRAMLFCDRFTLGYAPDGGCNEGPNYWGAAGASYFDVLELLYDMSGGKIDMFCVLLVKNMGEYIEKMHISGNRYVMFADAHPLSVHDGVMVARFGRRTGSKRLESFGAYLYAQNGPAGIGGSHIYRGLKSAADGEPALIEYRPEKRACLENLQVIALREASEDNKGLFMAVKGGHNNESHNHNDVGSFIVYSNGEPLVIDAGVGTYTAKTFSSKRYDIWTMQSAYHNLPTFNGVMQGQGREFCAQNAVFFENGAEFDLKGAYPAEAGLARYRRRAELCGGAVKVADDFKLNTDGEFFFSFMFADRPEVCDGYAMLTDGRRLEFDQELSPEVDEIDISSDAGLKHGWNRESLWRLRLCGKGGAGQFEFIIK